MCSVRLDDAATCRSSCVLTSTIADVNNDMSHAVSCVRPRCVSVRPAFYFSVTLSRHMFHTPHVTMTTRSSSSGLSIDAAKRDICCCCCCCHRIRRRSQRRLIDACLFQDCHRSRWVAAAAIVAAADRCEAVERIARLVAWPCV